MELQSSLNADNYLSSLGRDSRQKCVRRWSAELHNGLFWMPRMPRNPVSDRQALL